MGRASDRAGIERAHRSAVGAALALDSVVVTPELVAAITQGMTRCSQFVHDEPPGASVALPGRTELAADLAQLQEFERQTRS